MVITARPPRSSFLDCPRGVAPERMPKADATELAPKKSVIETLRHLSVPEGFWFQPFARQGFKITPISLVKPPSGGLGYQTRRPPGRFCRALQIRFLRQLGYRRCLYTRVSYPVLHHPSAVPAPGAVGNLRKQPEIF
jgi:hypothetical protein